jgi:hypothetical protein
VRSRAHSLLCLCAHGGLTGVPQVSIPGAEADGLPVGLSIGRRLWHGREARRRRRRAHDKVIHCAVQSRNQALRLLWLLLVATAT